MMSSPTRIAKLLAGRVTEIEELHRRRPLTNPHAEEIISSLLKFVDNICNSPSLEINSYMTLDYNDTEEFSNFEDESTASANENLGPSFDETVKAEKPLIKLNFSLDYMKNGRDLKGKEDIRGNVSLDFFDRDILNIAGNTEKNSMCDRCRCHV